MEPGSGHQQGNNANLNVTSSSEKRQEMMDMAGDPALAAGELKWKTSCFCSNHASCLVTQQDSRAAGLLGWGSLLQSRTAEKTALLIQEVLGPLCAASFLKCTGSMGSLRSCWLKDTNRYLRMLYSAPESNWSLVSIYHEHIYVGS